MKVELATFYLNEFGNHVEALEQLDSLTPEAQQKLEVVTLRTRAREMAVTWWRQAEERARLIYEAAPDCLPGVRYRIFCLKRFREAVAATRKGTS